VALYVNFVARNVMGLREISQHILGGINEEQAVTWTDNHKINRGGKRKKETGGKPIDITAKEGMMQTKKGPRRGSTGRGSTRKSTGQGHPLM